MLGKDVTIQNIRAEFWGGEAYMVPSVHFLVRQAARERVAAVRAVSEESKQRHLAMAELYARRAEEIRGNAQGDPQQAPT